MFPGLPHFSPLFRFCALYQRTKKQGRPGNGATPKSEKGLVSLELGLCLSLSHNKIIHFILPIIIILLCPPSDSPAPHTPSASSPKEKGTTALSAESETFRKCSADLIREIQDPELLAWELYSDDIIPEIIVDKVSVVGLSGVQRKTRLLMAVRDQIAVDRKKFQKLLLVLRSQPSLKVVADNLQQAICI